MEQKEFENKFYQIENNKNEFFHFIGTSFSIGYSNTYLEMYATINEKDLPSFATYLQTDMDFNNIYNAAKIKFKGIDIDKIKEILTENNIKFESCFFRD